METARQFRAAGAVSTVVFSTLAGGVGGFILALTLMAAPSGVLPTSACGPSTLVQDAGFDPWTGQPRGQIIRARCMDHEYVDEGPVPRELIGRTGFPWASALTSGFALGGFIAGWILWAIAARSKAAPETSRNAD